MRQHAINLMPQSIRLRTQAGAREARLALAAAVVLGLLLAVATHSWFSLMHEQDRLFDASVQAEPVFRAEARAAGLQGDLARSKHYIELYEQIASPLEISAVIAKVVNCLPESVTLDQMDIDAGIRMTARSPRARGSSVKEERPPRILTGEISGFAASDQHIAELVAMLDETPPFQNVSLDFSRAREIRKGQAAREFRLSFRIDLDSKYAVTKREIKALEPLAGQPFSTVAESQHMTANANAAGEVNSEQ